MAIVVLAMSVVHLAAGWTAAGGPEPTFFLGDVNCDGEIDSIDAALLLQREAGLIDSLTCPDNADMNQDGMINSVDAGLILQESAGLIRSPVLFTLSVPRSQGVCDDPDRPTLCDIPAGTEFGLTIDLDRVPPQGYTAFVSNLFYGELRYNPTTFAEDEVVWLDSGIALRATFRGPPPPVGTEGLISHGGISGATPPLRASTYRGPLVAVSLTCALHPGTFRVAILSFNGFSSDPTAVVLAGPGGTPTAQALTVGEAPLDLDLSGSIGPEEEHVDVASLLTINCIAPP